MLNYPNTNENVEDLNSLLSKGPFTANKKEKELSSDSHKRTIIRWKIQSKLAC